MKTTLVPTRCKLLVVDLQQRLLPAIEDSDTIINNAVKLLQSANLLGIDSIVTEQLPDRLGKTTEEISSLHHGPVFEKSSFSAATDPALLQSLEPESDVIILGTETHVCVLQTALQLLEQGRNIWVVNDACGSRTNTNKQTGLARMQNAGAILVTTEMVIFEWLADAQHPKFRDALAILK
mgnify:CR=1 FL=1